MKLEKIKDDLKNNIINALKYIITGSAENIDYMPTFNVVDDEYSLSKRDNNPPVLERIMQVIKGEDYPKVLDSINTTPTPTPTLAPTFTPTPTPTPIPDAKSNLPLTPTPPPQYPDMTLNNLSQQQKDFLENVILSQTRKKGLHDSLVASQWAMESGRSTGNPKNNVFGLMKGGELIQYPSVEANIDDYALTIMNNMERKGYDDWSDPYLTAVRIQEEPQRYETHFEDPFKYTHGLFSTPEYKYYNK
jgi:hypothetical protein